LRLRWGSVQRRCQRSEAVIENHPRKKKARKKKSDAVIAILAWFRLVLKCCCLFREHSW
jgi:hypothetical protein